MIRIVVDTFYVNIVQETFSFATTKEELGMTTMKLSAITTGTPHRPP
jgi:hypothetical protein